jgi:hypothetical protein
LAKQLSQKRSAHASPELELSTCWIVYAYSGEPENHLPASLICMAASRRTVMSQAFVGRATFKIIAVVVAALGLSACFSSLANAGPSFPAVLGLATLPLRVMTQGVLPHRIGAPRSHRHAARSPEPAIPVPVPAPTAHLDPGVDPNPPGGPAAVEARAEPVPTVEARAEPIPAVEPPQPAPPQPAPPPPAAMPPPPWPTASPSVYEDLLGYVLWPADYADRLWTHGYGDIMNTLLAPAAANADQAASMVEVGMCSAKASELANQLIARSSELIGPAPDQKAALDELGSALGEAIDRGRAAVCSGTGDPLKRMEDGLWIMWDATLLMRAPLEKFYDSLTEAQKAKLIGGTAASQALAQACAGQSGSGDRIEQALLARAQGADPQQRFMLETLRRQSAALIKFLAISCPRETKPNPMDRLEAAGDRMNALLYVAMSMSPALAELQQPSPSRQ